MKYRIRPEILILLILVGCSKPMRQFGTWTLWPKRATTQNAATQPAAPAAAKPPLTPTRSNSFYIRILETTGSAQCLKTAWSYLDESSPVSCDWQMLHRNGLRCGIGQIGDWPTLQKQLEKCGSKTRNEIQITLGAFNPVVLTADAPRPERTVFYYDANGRLHGKEVVSSSLQLVLVSAGRMAEGRIRVIFTPQMVRPSSVPNVPGVTSGAPIVSMQELQDFSIAADVGEGEFALLGPAGTDLPATLVGPQLFTQWDRGQKRSVYILLSPAGFGNEEPTKGTP